MKNLRSLLTLVVLLTTSALCVRADGTIAPSVPTALAVTVVSSAQVDLSWTGSVAPGAYCYKVFRDGMEIASQEGTSYSDCGLTFETIYSYQIAAVSATGVSSAKTAVAAATTSALPPGKTIFVDKRLASSITDGSYDPATRRSIANGGKGNAYPTIKAAVAAMNSGTTILIREGVYKEEYIKLPYTKSGTSWKEGEFNTLASYPGEHAVIDGDNNAVDETGALKAAIGAVNYDGAATHLKYWKFERLEIRGGSDPQGSGAAGFCGNGGPFIFRRCYVHDNSAFGINEVETPAGLKGLGWHDSVVEQCLFENNGNQSSGGMHLAIYADYKHRITPVSGYDPAFASAKRNEFRYNFFSGGGNGFKYKGSQLFSSRKQWDDTYSTYGDKFHHNIWKDIPGFALGAHQDFIQVYNNIFDNCGTAILVQYEPLIAIYKAVVFNNTILNSRTAINRYGSNYCETVLHQSELLEYHGWDYNNIISNCDLEYSLLKYSTAIFDLSGQILNDNYFHHYGNTNVAYVHGLGQLSVTQFAAWKPTSILYTLDTGGAPLFSGTTEPAKYKTISDHVLSGAKTIKNGGVGVPHPFLLNVAIPNYVGATDPFDNDWVDRVLGLTADKPATETNAPTVPTNFQAQFQTGLRISLSWAASSDDSCVDSYVIYRDGVLLCATGATAYIDNLRITSGKNYSYTIVAVDVFGNKSGTSACSCTTPGAPDTTPPTATGNFKAVATASNCLTLTWAASTDNEQVVGYKLYRDGVEIADQVGRAYTDTGLISSTTYIYQVRAYDTVGNLSVASSATGTPAVVKTIYVDKTLPSNITDGGYDPALRASNVTTGRGNAYRTVQAAMDALAMGDTVYLRGGVYMERSIRLPLNRNGASWQQGNYTTIASYPGEWAVLDGENLANGTDGRNAVIGYPAYGGGDLRYWKFERLEIRNGRSVDGQAAAGFWGNGGPFWFRFCYIHDNTKSDLSSSGTETPSGLKGSSWSDSIIEYCVFRANGSPAFPGFHISIYSDYEWGSIATNGYTPTSASGKRNAIRYNLFLEGTNGFKYKGAQIFSGRNPNDGHGLSDEYSTYGDNIHHNIFKDLAEYGVMPAQDFAQVHHNIFDNCTTAIEVQEITKLPIYKAVTYNNTIIGATDGVVRHGCDSLSVNYGIDEQREYHGYDYNNIIDAPSNLAYYLFPYNNGNKYAFDFTNTHFQNNYVYRAAKPVIANINSSSPLTAEQFRSQTITAPVTVLYHQPYDPLNPLFQGTTGAPKYITLTSHTVGNGATIANAGAGMAHPYLPTVAIPSYLGAANPSDHAWVSGLLAMEAFDGNGIPAGLLNAPADDPTWIEGSSTPADTTAPSVPIALTGSAISATAITVIWTASTDNVGVTGYRIYRDGSQAGTSATNSYTDTGRTIGTTYSYQVAAFDAAGNVSGFSAAVSVIAHDETYTSYATWRTGSFNGAEQADAISGPNADPDGCGLSNFQRYAFSLAARGPVATPTTLGTATSGADQFLTLTFNRRASASDLSYSVESSTDLIIWTPVPGLLYAPGDGPITAQDTVAMSAVARRFLRVRVQAP